jgi:hypothetical protein
MEIELPGGSGITKLPARIELLVYLIKAEIKHFKFMHGLEAAGIDASSCSLDFASLVLRLAGFEERPDQIFDWYNQTVQELSGRLNACDDNEHLTELAFDFVQRLEKKKADGAAPELRNA